MSIQSVFVGITWEKDERTPPRERWTCVKCGHVGEWAESREKASAEAERHVLVAHAPP